MHAVNTRQQASTYKDPEEPPRLCSLQDAVRRRLERAPSHTEEEAARSLFYRLVPTARRDV